MAAPTGLSITASAVVGAAPFTASITATATDPDTGPVTIRVQWPDGATSTVNSGTPATRMFNDPIVGTAIVTPLDSASIAGLSDTVTIVIDAPDGLDILDRGDGGCGTPWIVPADLAACPVYQTADPDDIQAAIDAAIRFLNEATCYRWRGVCTAIIVPPDTLSGCSTSRSLAYNEGIDLTRWVPGPIRVIDEVVVDGQPVDPSNYRLVNHKRIKPQAPSGDDSDSLLDPWPPQDPHRPLGDLNTWYLVVQHGRIAPPALVHAARRLACEMLKALYAPKDCDLPDGVTSVTRDGVTLTFAARQPGQTGIPAIDMIIDRFGCLGRRNNRIVDPATEKAEVRHYL